ncbi:MAG: choice-of-anchor I domain-containing protein [Ignavibacteria bacterium]|jgi:hypothetical protein
MRRISVLCVVLSICLLPTELFSQTPTQGNILQLLSRHTQRPATFDQGSAEVVTYDSASRIAILSDAFANKLTFVSIANPALPTIVRDVALTPFGGKVNSVAVKNGLVAVALEDAVLKSNPGKVVFLDMTGNLRSQVIVGALPDMLAFTPNGQRVIVCNEAEPENNYAVDPEGSVSIINVTNPTSPTVQTVTFTSLNGKQDSLRALGVRIYGFRDSLGTKIFSSVAQDLEPEYAAISPDGATAYVTLQENNAIAVIDINNAALLRVMPLGWKDYSKGLPRSTNYTWSNRPVLGTTPAGQQILMGGFSGLWFDGYGADSTKLRFLTHPDRGPNAEPLVIRGQTRRPFALPNYQAEVIRIELDRVSGAFTVLNRTKLTRTDGTTPITGLPNLQAGAQGTAYTDELPVDLFGNDIANDPFGADLEGLVVDNAGTWWMVDEYRPAIYNFTNTGKLIDRYIPAGTAASVGAAAGTYGNELLPAVYAQRRANRGFEACAIEGDILYAFIQSPIDNPDNATDATSKASTFCRIIAMNVVTKQIVGEYLYPMFEKAGSCDKIGDAVSLGGGKFFVVERDDATGLRARKYVFEINLKGATNLAVTTPTLPAGKTLEQCTFAELAAAGVKPVVKKKSVYLPGAGYGSVDKVEGIARINATTFAVVNDNDFGVGGSLLPSPPNGSITVSQNDPILGIITFDRPNGLDPSDRDNAAGSGAAVKIGNWPVYGMYQPDAITAVTIGGQTYLATANEGDAREWGTFIEEVRAGAATYPIDASILNAFPSLKSNPQLGRLNVVTNMGDLDGDGVFDEIYTLGGRGFTLWNADGNLIWDSGNELETRTAAFYPSNFNAGHTTNSMDDRSDNKGPEPEAITSTVLNDSTYVLVGNERIGGVFMYNISNVIAPTYSDYLNARNFTVTPSLANVDNGTVGDLGPEVICHIPSTASPNNTDLLLVGNEISGTMSVMQLKTARILTQPATALTQCIGDRITLSVAAQGPSLSYQWRRNGTNIAGATSATYTFDAINSSAAGTYTCTITPANGLPASTKPTVLTLFTRTRITREPRVLTQIDAGLTVDLDFEATSTAGETLQWFRAGQPLANSAKYAGVTTNKLTIRNVTFADTSGRYYCTVVGGCSSLRTRDARVYIPRIAFTEQAADTVVCPGDTITLTSRASSTGGDVGVQYKWRLANGTVLNDGGRFSGTSSPTLRITKATAADAQEYICVATGFPSNDSRFSRNVTVSVRPMPTILRQPVAPNGTSTDVLCEGTFFQFSIAASGSTTLRYQWLRDGAPIALATANTYATTKPGKYAVRVTGDCGQAATSDVVTITNAVKPSFTLNPAPRLRVKEGDPITLRVEGAGTPVLVYQWQRNGKDIVGATLPTLTIAAAAITDEGKYVCVIKNECGLDVSYVSDVTVYKNNPVSVDEESSEPVVSLYPNPTSQTVTIAVGASTKIDRVEVVNAAGSLVLVRNGESAAASSMNIDLSSLASGVYTATVFSSGHRTSTMLVITR